MRHGYGGRGRRRQCPVPPGEARSGPHGRVTPPRPARTPSPVQGPMARWSWPVVACTASPAAIGAALPRRVGDHVRHQREEGEQPQDDPDGARGLPDRRRHAEAQQRDQDEVEHGAERGAPVRGQAGAGARADPRPGKPDAHRTGPGARAARGPSGARPQYGSGRVGLDGLVAESLAVRADEIAARDLAAEHEDGTGGPAHVWGSASLLRRVVDNLLDNAVRHNRNGGPDSGCRSLRPSRTPIAGGGAAAPARGRATGRRHTAAVGGGAA